MRILMITDSLGIPRQDLDVQDVWVFKLIEELRLNHQVITHLHPGLSIEDVVRLRENLFLLYKPELVILQLGIVDCSRRVLPKEFVKIVSKFRLLSKLIQKFAKRYHYQITRLFDFKYVQSCEFKLYIDSLGRELAEKNINLCIIAIAPPGKFLLDTTYAIAKDIEQYNKLFQAIESSQIIYVNPYNGQDAANILNIADGHHLNPVGHDLVYKHVKEAINVFIK